MARKLAWPRRSRTVCRSAPPASSHEAWACRRSWTRTRWVIPAAASAGFQIRCPCTIVAPSRGAPHRSRPAELPAHRRPSRPVDRLRPFRPSRNAAAHDECKFVRMLYEPRRGPKRTLTRHWEHRMGANWEPPDASNRTQRLPTTLTCTHTTCRSHVSAGQGAF